LRKETGHIHTRNITVGSVRVIIVAVENQ
jgi:hypothetical protein